MLLFLSHSGADTPSAVELKRRILETPAARGAGLEVWLDKDELRAGRDTWQPQLEEAIDRASAFCVYVGSLGVTNWVEREVRLGLSRATGAEAIPFIPALAAEARSAALPPFARQHQAIRDPLGDPDALADLIAAALGGTRQQPLVEEPFVGLRAMGERDAHLFFGREDEVAELAEKVRRHPIVAVVSDSGAGKSSLVRAGLVPAFRGGALEPDNRAQPEGVCRHLVVMRPGGDAQEGLKRGVDEAAEALGCDADARSSLRRRVDLGDVSETAFAIRCDLPNETDTLLVIDQFEELLTQAKPDEAGRFVDFLLALVDPRAQRGIRVVLTIRADYFNLFKPHSDLFARLMAEDGSAQLRLKRVSDTGLANVVRNPLRMAGHQDAGDRDALLAAIRQDVSDRPGDLALIQMALFATWRQAKRDRTPLAAAYAQVGGVLGALAHEAERVRAEVLSPAERELLLPLFARLVRLGDTGGATRRPAALAGLGAGREELARKLAGDQGGRLLQTGEARAEIAHEALITQWPWLQAEIQAAAPDIRRLGRLDDAAADWDGGGRRRDLLPGSGALADFQALRSRRGGWTSSDEGQFLDQAARNARLARLVRMAAIVVLVTLSAGMGLFGWWALKSEGRALAAAGEANRAAWSAKRNEAGALAALSTVALQSGRPVDAVKLALAAWPRQGGRGAPELRQAIASIGAAIPNLRERLRLEGHGDTVTSVAFSPDGTRLVTGSDDGTARLWELASGAEIARLEGHGGAVTSLAFSPDGRHLATGSVDGTARLWDVVTGAETARLEGHGGYVTSVAFAPDGTRLATGSAKDDTARLWDLATGAETARIEMGSAWSVAFSPDGTRLATGSWRGTALWDLATGAETARLEGHENWIGSVAFSPDGTLLATGSYDRTARLWDLATGVEIARLEGHESAVISVAFSPDGRRFATGSHDRTVRLWDPANGMETARLEGHEDGVSSVAFSPDGTRLATGSGDRTARLWDLATGAEIARLEGYWGVLRGVAFSPNETCVATVSNDRTARLWDLATGAQTARLEGHEDVVTSVAFSPDGTRVATVSADRTARLWDRATGVEIARLEGHGGGVTSVAFSPDGTRLATGSDDATARLWNLATGAETARIEGHGGGVTSVAFSPDGTRLATGSDDRTARLWDLATGAEIARLEGHWGRAISVVFSPDGTRLVTGSDDATARPWDLAATPTGNAFALACASLPVRDGVRDTDLAEALAGASIEISEPICGPGYDPPMPWWITPDGIEPRPPREPE